MYLEVAILLKKSGKDRRRGGGIWIWIRILLPLKQDETALPLKQGESGRDFYKTPPLFQGRWPSSIFNLIESTWPEGYDPLAR
jgi:hypothetical protein